MIRIIEMTNTEIERVIEKELKDKYGILSSPHVNTVYEDKQGRIGVIVYINSFRSTLSFSYRISLSGKFESLEKYNEYRFKNSGNKIEVDPESYESYIDEFAKEVLNYIEQVKNDPRVTEVLNSKKTDKTQKYIDVLNEFISAGPDMEYNYLLGIASENDEGDLIDFLNSYCKNKSLYCINSEENIIGNPISYDLPGIIDDYLERTATRIDNDTNTSEIYELNGNYYWYKYEMGYSELITDAKGLKALMNSIEQNKKVFRSCIGR